MRVQTIDPVSGKPRDYSALKHGTTGEIVKSVCPQTLGEEMFKYDDGSHIYVDSLKKAGAQIVEISS